MLQTILLGTIFVAVAATGRYIAGSMLICLGMSAAFAGPAVKK